MSVHVLYHSFHFKRKIKKNPKRAKMDGGEKGGVNVLVE